MAILERITRNIDNRYWDAGVEFFPVKNRYTAGVAGQRFFNELKEKGTLIGSRCDKCSITYVPARIYCERCFARLENWVDVGLKGTLFSHTVVHRAKNGSLLNNPTTVVAVKIADGLIIHRLGEFDPEQIEIGMPLQAVLKAKDKRVGAITDIEYFKPA